MVKTKKSYCKMSKNAKSNVNEMENDKKPAAIVPCPIKSLQNFAMSMKVNPALAMNQLRRDVRWMNFPRTVANRIIEDTISKFELIGHAHGDFSSIRAKENARRVLNESEDNFHRLMSNICVISSNVMPIESEPLPEKSILKLFKPNHDSNKLLVKLQDHRYYEKNTRGLNDIGADDCTTNDPYIIFDLQVLLKHLWIELHNAGKNLHISRYAGISYLRMCDGAMKKFLMRYTPSMRIAVVDMSKLRDPTMVCFKEGDLIDHKNESYSYVLPLVKFSHRERKIERYYLVHFEMLDPNVAP